MSKTPRQLWLNRDFWTPLSAEQVLTFAGIDAPPGTRVWARAVDWQHSQVMIVREGFNCHNPRFNIFDPAIEAITGGMPTLKDAMLAALADRQNNKVRTGEWPETRTQGRNL